MIKICSLDFLNREIFETDVMTADGLVLAQSGEKITPDVLLRLYFKEIYIEQPLAEKEHAVSKVAAAVLADVAEDTSNAEIALETDVADEFAYEDNNFVVPDVDIEEVSKKKKAKKGPKSAQNDSNDEETDEKDPKQAELDLDDEKSPKSAGNKFDSDEDEADKAEDKGKSPRKAKSKFEDDDEGVENGGKGPKTATEASGSENEKGPKAAGLNFDSVEEDGEVVRGPKSAGLSKFEDDFEDNKPSPKVKNFAMGEEVEVPKINPEEMPLVFDEEQAKRIKQYSAQLAKIAGFSQEEIKEIELIAYNCNIGITKFKKADETRKSFRKMKIFASYEKLIEEETIPQHLAEMIKYIINPYESDAFKLNSKIPYYHIVAITSYYEEMLAQGKDKSDILLKMLELGGHRFNIFVLHKFIKMMRDAND